MTASDTELARFKAARDTAIHRLRLIEQGAQIVYEDGTPVDMASEKARLEEVVAGMDRRIARLELAAAKATGPLN
ncbi:hypothetical protein [Brevundimonas sp. NIBR11]|uniref:hypothetical protein n=1 Tax=Brevundimonas sp. NIBR11 TaxID=3015999 RepID=UPI0022F0A23B|nr:hypothetical protein [Brevundimonas sp. NIBR11]WGM32329.1 hypothetical protein KKHFBJBL_02580 [Brevundimonas sp. NIBR11]